LNSLKKFKINTNKTQSLLKNIEDRILKEKLNRQNNEIANIVNSSNSINERNKEMAIDVEMENELYKITSNEIDINQILHIEKDSNKNNCEASKTKINSEINNREDVKKHENINFGQKRNFNKFFSKNQKDNSVSNSFGNNESFKFCNKISDNLIGFSRSQNPFTPINSISINYQKIYPEAPNNSYEIYNSNLNSLDQQLNIKKTIPFQNNFNNLNSIISNSNVNNKTPTSNSLNNNINNQTLINLQENSNYFVEENQNQNNFLNYSNFANFNHNFSGFSNNREDKNTFSKALINNKIYTEDNHDFIEVFQSQGKKSNYREGLFDKNNLSHSVKNDFIGFPRTEPHIRKDVEFNIKNAEYISEGEENKEKGENTDEDQIEIRTVDETLQKYLDEEKIINDKKLKISVIRKIAPFYKVISQPSNEDYFNDTLEKIKAIINEPNNDIVFLLHYEYLKNLREKVFQKFCKMINKFFFKLNENKIKEFGGENYNLEIPETLKERLKNIYTKINDYFERNKELE